MAAENTPATPDVLARASEELIAIFWCTQASLEEMPWPFQDLDYLFDGLLSQAIREKHHPADAHSKQYKTHFYLGRNFGRPFSLMHVERALDLDQLCKDILNHAQVFSKNREGSGSGFLVVTDTAGLAKDLESKLKKKDKVFHFDFMHA